MNMEKKEKILHFITNSTFSEGYINFMRVYMNEWTHIFIIKKKASILKGVEQNNIIYIKSYGSLFLDSNIKREILTCNKFIISGVFTMQYFLPFFPLQVLEKTYLQFWGGDFYCFRNTQKNVKKNINRGILKQSIKRCAGIITLIDGDYLELEKIFQSGKKHFVAVVPPDPNKKIDYSQYRDKIHGKKHRIIIGNSATKENQHLEIFKMLEKLNDTDVEIYCPLSYGDPDYKARVIEEGKRLFGMQFNPITDFMPIEEYTQFLSTCEVGIFNNDRQQALGNISMLLKLGKKIYIRKDTAMWNEYRKWDIEIHDVSELLGICELELFNYSDRTRVHNYIGMDIRETDFIRGWERVLSDKL